MQHCVNVAAEFVRNVQIIWSCINNYGDPAGKMCILESELESLISREEDINAEVECVESTHGRKRKREVENWLSNVRRKVDEFSSLKQEVENAGLLSKITSSINWVNRLNQLTEEVKELRKQGEFGQGLAQNYISGYELPTKELVGDTFRQNLQKILSYLMNDDVWRIGVFGMGGVGKTTLIKHIYNKLLKNHNTYWKVALVVVSQECSPDELQYKIAKCLSIDLSNVDDRINRAGKLSNFLMGKKFVLILDDIWNMYDLKEVGLPIDEIGCKLILTTRKLDVCNQMECQVSVKVETLHENEAWHLFMKNLRRTKLFPPEVEKIGRSVAKECGGLPLGIVVVSGSMRGAEDIHEWRNALEALKEANFMEECMEVKVFGVLKFSYTRLSDAVAQRCFLQMALYPEDHMVERSELIRYFMNIGLICSRTREGAYDRGHTLVNQLINFCLLESVKRIDILGKEIEELKIHDLLRDMAINMMSPRYMVKAGLHLREIPEEAKWTQNLEGISLMANLIVAIPEGLAPHCPRLEFLCLSNNTSLMALPNAFFENMPALQVLDLSRTNIKFLPSSISNLKNLVALLLRGCRELKLVPSLAKMEELRTLDLCESGIQDAPEGLDRMVNLRSFDLNGSELRKLPPGVLLKLTRLQYLNLGSKLYAEGREIMSMRNLEALKCNFADEKEFNQYTAYLDDGRGPKKWDLRLGCIDYDEVLEGDMEDYSGIVRLSCTAQGWQWEERLQLPRNVKLLTMESFVDADLRSLMDIPSFNQVTNMKACMIGKVKSVECVVPLSKDFLSHRYTHLRSLEFLRLDSLEDLRVLVEIEENFAAASAIPRVLSKGNTFWGLKKLEINKCCKLKKLLTHMLLPLLANLEVLSIQCCSKVEELIKVTGDEITALTLPKLRTLVLRDLHALESICSSTIICDSLRYITLKGCCKLKRIPLRVCLPQEAEPPSSYHFSARPHTLQRIEIKYNDMGWWKQVEWDHIRDKSLLKPYVQYWAY